MNKIILVGGGLLLIFELLVMIKIRELYLEKQEIKRKLKLIELRINVVETLNDKYFEKEQEAKEELVSLVRMRSIEP
jgi:hypothetical protein